MADIVLTDAYVALGGVDVSDYVKSVTLSMSRELVDNTAMGDTARSRVAGLKDSSVTIEFQQDFADNLIDEILWGHYDSGSAITVAVRPTSSGISTGNPEYQVSSILESFTPIGNTVGERAMASVTFQGTGAVVRDVTA